ncbi:PQQ-dependent sugar dehydrogenase [Dactylosporangium sp. AC04546]|uniref:PQQ-dependent sugar dehydrogenase n=1 Tax=Dactylosporangium sp. AC04546 TaxID=2862460 RepID=UPI001EDEDF63|nr:PQQ-dependent sugar dehydrogenase [Dactylosporangium sp. AC04546]WVK87111.1 PQQ-dependent sugar dehydrogenase [Dactylosporangium sp. AC04546]
MKGTRTARRWITALVAAGVAATVLPPSLAAEAAAIRYEAEDATISGGVVESNHAGHSGRGFVNYDNVTGSSVEWTVNAATAGTATIGLRFANGTTIDRPMDVSVNGTVVSPALSFPGTGTWDTWQTRTITAAVTAGANRIRATATTANGGPNVDWIDFDVAPPTSDYQAENATIAQGVVESNHNGYTGTGFVNYDNIAGSYVQWSVPSAAAGNVSVAVRYANGTTTDRPMDITVNGTLVRGALSFPSTGTWDTWQVVTFTVGLAAGTNLIRAAATTANGGPNVDKLSAGVPGDTSAPTAPGQPACASITENSLLLSWGASTDNVGVVAYDIYHDGNKIGEAAGTATSKSLTGLQPNFEYRLSVFGRDAAGNVSTSSPQAICRTLASSDTQAPTTPANFATANVAGNSVGTSWTASTDNVGVTGYDVLGAGGSVLKSVGNVTSTTVAGLACNTTYTLTVVAKDAAGNISPPSNARTITTTACSGGVPSGITTVSTGWTIPWGVAWLPDGQTAIATERDSFKVFKVTLGGARTQVGTVPNTVTTNGEGGLLGVAVDPNWNSNHYVYFMHTAAEGNRIARMTYNGTTLTAYTSLVTGIMKNRYHNGGRLAFGPDGYLYATTGEAQTPSLAQDKNSLNGKILRMRTDGTPAPGNPFGTLVYSYGHRNPQGIAWDSQGRLWEAEFGNSQYDELNLIKPGRNYGWPTCEGTCSVAGMENPKRQWSVSTASPSAIAIVRDVVYMAALRGERLWRIPLLDGENTGSPTAYYVGTYGRLRTVVKVPGADQLWLSTTNCDNNGGAAAGSDQIFRITIA